MRFWIFFLLKIRVLLPFVSLISLNYSFNVVVHKISLLIYLWWLSCIFVLMFFGIYFFQNLFLLNYLVKIIQKNLF